VYTFVKLHTDAQLILFIAVRFSSNAANDVFAKELSK